MSARVRELRFAIGRHLRRPVAGRFQPYPYTLPDRYPWLFSFARATLAEVPAPRILSFGCSRGDELLSLRRYLPTATIRGLDIAPANIAACAAAIGSNPHISTAVAANTQGEAPGAYDAIFCLAVLCHGDLTVTRAARSDRLFRFADFERTTADFARCLKPGGLLFLHTTNFRFGDTATAAEFDTLLEARPEHLAADLLYDRDNRLIPGARYLPVCFRKRMA